MGRDTINVCRTTENERRGVEGVWMVKMWYVSFVSMACGWPRMVSLKGKQQRVGPLTAVRGVSSGRIRKNAHHNRR